VLVEADAGFLGDAGGVGIEGLEKITDLRLYLFPNFIPAWWSDLTGWGCWRIFGFIPLTSPIFPVAT
jgi:hypothetical protein